jgi:two-component system, LytTR family, response regulator
MRNAAKNMPGMVTAIIIDDEQNSVLMLQALLTESCPAVHIAGTANNARSGKELIASVKPQLIFLDIEMPLGSGFELLRSLPSIDFEIIFITAYNQYAIKAFVFSALDYLEKPVRTERLMNATDKAIKRIKEKAATRDYELLLRNMNEQNPAKQRLAFTERGQQFLVAIEDIMYLLADGNYVHVHTTSKVFLTAKTLKDFEEILPADLFCRTHKAHIVNVHFIARVQKGRIGTISMKDGKILEIAARRKEVFMKTYKAM